MNLIKQNPFNVIGVFSEVSQRSLTKRKAKINALKNVGKEVSFIEDIECFGKPNRSKEDIQKAFSDIEINKNKVFYSLFWFTQIDHIDKTALNNLRANNIEKAKDIWQRVIEGRPITSKSFSAYNNLGTLKLHLVFRNSTIDFDELGTAILLKTELIKSKEFAHYCRIIADETYKVNQDEELENFITALIQQVKNKKQIETSKLLAFISQIDERLRSIVVRNFTSEPINNIEKTVKQAKKGCAQNPEQGFKLSNLLYKDTKDDLRILSDILGVSDMKYKMIADKVAKEILQCAIAYFNCFNKKEESHGGSLCEDILQLFKLANSIAMSNDIKERISENINGVQEWINGAYERRREKLIEHELRFISSKLENFRNSNSSFADAENLIHECKPTRLSIKEKLGEHDDLYLKISTTIASSAQGMVINITNDAVDKRSRYVKYKDSLYRRGIVFDPPKDFYLSGYISRFYTKEKLKKQETPYAPEYSIDELKIVIKQAWRITRLIGALDMTQQQRASYDDNKNRLKSVAEQVGVPTSIGQSIGKTMEKSSCYIATMAYGSYEHPQVIVLRDYRDNVLSKYYFGRILIKLYYCYSPKIVAIAKDKDFVNKIVRALLNNLIRLIK